MTLYEERGRLIQKKFTLGGLSGDDQDRLAIIDTLIDRVEAREMGPDLDRLEQRVAAAESIASQTKETVEWLRSRTT